jgi:hypothetical protein
MKPTRLMIRTAACLIPLSLVLICVVTPMVLPAQDVAATQPGEAAIDSAAAGEVRITDLSEAPEDLLEAPALDLGDYADDAEAAFEDDAGEVTLSDLWSAHSLHFVSRNRQQSELLANWMFDRLGLYTPASAHTAPIGTYKMVYPVNPSYNDPRDARIYGAQGAGIPIVVPLAPNVRSSYNYGSGLPASRLTPISVPR